MFYFLLLIGYVMKGIGQVHYKIIWECIISWMFYYLQKNKIICCLTLFIFVMLRLLALEAKSYVCIPNFWKLGPSCMSWNSAASNEDMECSLPFNVLLPSRKRSQNLRVIDFLLFKENHRRWIKISMIGVSANYFFERFALLLLCF